ncbi:hypothetical protein FGW37_22825 [Streptomyces rectiverticillatus]|uniref:hypothetical protein n=1 Tax=Streptomyces rectiverticillatus TaxID=173860 RepID=UPI0015C2E067|nr:hypothetical protein [Streptomyces rectiverticillatus]QLE74039.1 hypothetical protein FGW37_22825 [Streptomyces rectiverticillatus]
MPSEGPRHAAPRKPLLARLHMPAGKAVALAAMPSAVLMGMGLTPTLASAKPAPKKLFDGACATAPDTAAEGETPDTDASGAPSGKPSGKPSAGPSAAPGAGASSAPAEDRKKPEKAENREKPAAPGKGTSARPGAPSGSPSPAAPKPPPSPSPSSSPSAAKHTNPLDPLGLGDKLHDILTGGTKTGEKPAPPPASPGPASSAPAPQPSAQSGKPRKDPAQKPGEQDKGKGEEKGGPSAGPSTSPGPAPSGSTSPSAAPEAGDGELPPCPKGTVVDENEHHAFPNQPWYLEASKLTLTGLTYEGIKKITMVNGEKKDVLKFTADSLAIKDLHQIVNSRGKQYHVAGMGTESTITGGKVTMYTEELKGSLLGIIPATHSPSIPPPLIPGLKLPIPVFYTNVKIRQAGQFGGTLHIPNLHQYMTDGTYP